MASCQDRRTRFGGGGGASIASNTSGGAGTVRIVEDPLDEADADGAGAVCTEGAGPTCAIAVAEAKKSTSGSA